MKIVVGLGNPGKEYENTRHNSGKIVVGTMKQLDGFKYFQSDVFMNNSGEFVRKVLSESGADPKDLYLVHDDWAFEPGEFKIQFARGHNNHNGVKSVMESLGTKDFWRIRIGIGMYDEGLDPSDYVLGKFSKSELKLVKDVAIEVGKSLEEEGK